MTADNDLEDRLLRIVQGTVIASGIALAAGLVLHVVWGDGPLSRTLLALGLVLLMATPALRVMIATAERVRRTDWLFVAATLAVLGELAVTLWIASRRL